MTCDNRETHKAHWLHVEVVGSTVHSRGLCDGMPDIGSPYDWTLPGEHVPSPSAP